MPLKISPSFIEWDWNYCELESLDFGIFANLSNVMIVELSYNKLKTVVFPATLPVFRELQFIDLSHNQLSTISINYTKFPKLEKLKLAGNDFTCASPTNFHDETHFCNGAHIIPSAEEDEDIF